MAFYDHELECWVDSYEIMLCPDSRVDIDVDQILFSDNQEDALNDLIDYKYMEDF